MPKQVSNVIYVGPAGTGKTLAAKRRAIEIIDGSAPTSLAQVSARFRALCEQRLIFAPTLHPTYAYADWIEGFRPTMTDEGDLEWTIEKGIFLEAVEACGSSSGQLLSLGWTRAFDVGETITSSTRAMYDVVSVTDAYLTLRRHDDRTTQVAKQDTVTFADVRACLEAGIKPEDLSHSGGSVESREARKDVAHRLGWTTTKLTNAGGLRAVFERVLESGLETGGANNAGESVSEQHRVVLLIDEINRADAARLWGETLTVLEPNKREGQPEEQSVMLQFSRRLLTVPSNLHIIGTMNSADRSVSQFDVAYRRRFDFVFTGPDPALLQEYGGFNTPLLLQSVNRYLLRTLGRDRQVGHAELMVHKLEARRLEHEWSDDESGRLRSLAFTLRVWLVPLLRDLFGNDLARVREALGPASGLIEEFDDPIGTDDDFLPADEDLLTDAGEWWDPTSPKWSEVTFRKALPGSFRNEDN